MSVGADSSAAAQRLESVIGIPRLRRPAGEVYGTFHKVSIKHLGRYCNEFSYRFNRRGEQLATFAETLKHLTRGKALPYKKQVECIKPLCHGPKLS